MARRKVPYIKDKQKFMLRHKDLGFSLCDKGEVYENYARQGKDGIVVKIFALGDGILFQRKAETQLLNKQIIERILSDLILLDLIGWR